MGDLIQFIPKARKPKPDLPEDRSEEIAQAVFGPHYFIDYTAPDKDSA